MPSAPRQHRRNGFGDTTIFRFLRLRLSAILDCQNFELLVIDPVAIHHIVVSPKPFRRC